MGGVIPVTRFFVSPGEDQGTLNKQIRASLLRGYRVHVYNSKYHDDIDYDKVQPDREYLPGDEGKV